MVVLGSRCLIQDLQDGEIFWIAVARLYAIDAICSACLDPRAESRGKGLETGKGCEEHLF